MDRWEVITKGTVIQHVLMWLQLWYTLLHEFRGGKENFDCDNSVTLGEKYLMHIIYLFLYDNIEQDSSKKKKSDALNSLKRCILWYPI